MAVLVSGLTLRRWQAECRLVEERFSLFRPFAEAPFFGFRGIVSRPASIYNITVAAEMDTYPKYVPLVFVTPTILDAREDGKLCVDVDWQRDSTFADVIGALIAYIDGTCRESGT
jgi:hypothetical protein